jgi:hypothetical protein
MNINLFTKDDLLHKYFSYDSLSDKVFIDWYPVTQDNIEQVDVLEECIKYKKRTILFDRYSTLNNNEVDHILKYGNIKLFEPRLITRLGFEYMPYWYEFQNSFELENPYLKLIDFGYVVDQYRDVNYVGIKGESYKDIRFTLLSGNQEEYNVGYLPNMKEILDGQCVPLLPIDNKYFNLLFRGLRVETQNDIDYIINLSELDTVLIYSLFHNMKYYYPEMLIDNHIIKREFGYERDKQT